MIGLWNLKDIQNSRLNCSKNKLVRDNVVRRMHHGSCSLWVMGSCTLLNLMYSGTSPYDHPVYKTTSLLRPHSFKPNVKTIDSVYYFEDPVNATTSLLRPRFYGPTVVALTGFHCSKNLPENVLPHSVDSTEKASPL